MARTKIFSDLQKIDEHVITPDEYDDAPEITDEELARAVLHEAIVKEEKEEEFPWAQDDDERRRSFVFVQFTDAASANMGFHEIKPELNIHHMELVYQWLKDGKLPSEKTTSPGRNTSSLSKLRTI